MTRILRRLHALLRAWTTRRGAQAAVAGSVAPEAAPASVTAPNPAVGAITGVQGTHAEDHSHDIG